MTNDELQDAMRRFAADIAYILLTELPEASNFSIKLAQELELYFVEEE